MRNTFGGSTADNVIQAPSGNSNIVKVLPDATGGTAWSAETGGSQYTDIIAIGTDPAPICTDGDGFVRAFQGPDGIEGLWVDFGGRRRYLKARETGTAAAVATLVNTPGSAPDVALRGKYVADIMLVGAGIDPTGATDSSSAVQAIITANPGRRIRFPAGIFKLATGLTLSKGQELVGDGWRDYRDRFTTFGTAGWLVDANFNGTVLRFTGTTGTAITIVDSEVTEGALADFILIGPGSGTSTGIYLGSAGMSTVHPVVRNVKVGNFAVGVNTQNVDEASAYDLTIHGCTTGLVLGPATNNNGFYGLDLQRNVTGCTIDATSYANAFYSAIGQSNTGTAFKVSGVSNAWFNPYLENNTTRGLDFLSGATGNTIDTPWLNGAGDGVRFQAGADHCALRGAPGTVAGPVVNAATGTYLQGRFPNLADTGNGTTLLDPGASGSLAASWASYVPALGGTGWALGNGAATGYFSLSGPRTVHFRGTITFGSTSTYGSVSPTISVPYFLLDRGLVEAKITRSGVITYKLAPQFTTSGFVFTLFTIGTNGAMGSLTSTFPATWASGDLIEFAGTFERT